MQLEFLRDEYSIYRLPPSLNSEAGATDSPSLVGQLVNELEREVTPKEFYTVSRTPDEISIAVPSRLGFVLRAATERLPIDSAALKTESGFRCFRVCEPLAFDVVGVIADISRVLAETGIPLLSLSTFDTDYFFVGKQSEAACRLKLDRAGYSFQR